MKHAFRLLAAGLCLVWAQAPATAGPVTLPCESRALEFRDRDELKIEAIDLSDALRGLAGSETTDATDSDYHDARCGTENPGMARLTDLRVAQPFASATALDRVIGERLEAGTSADDFVLASAITLGNTPCLALDVISIMQEAFTDDARTLEPRPLEPSPFAEVDAALRRRVDVADFSSSGNLEPDARARSVSPLGLANLHRHTTSSLSRPAHRRSVHRCDGTVSTRPRRGGSVIPCAAFMDLSGHSLLDGPGACSWPEQIANDDGLFA